MGKAIGKHPLLQPAAAVAVHQPYDGSDRPSAGTECAWCREGGHFCQAKGYVGNEPVCEACGQYQLCPQIQEAERLHAGNVDERLDPRFRRDPGRTLELTDEMRKPIAGTPDSETTGQRVWAFPESEMRGRGRHTKKYVRCPFCDEEMGTGELAQHKPRCPNKPVKGKGKALDATPAAPTPDVEKAETEVVCETIAKVEETKAPDLETRLVAESTEEHELNQVWALLSLDDRWAVLGDAVGQPCLTAATEKVLAARG